VKQKQSSEIGPPLPHSREAERAILGSIILGAEFPPDLDVGDFFLPFHQVLYQILQRRKLEGKPSNDLVLLANELGPEEIERIGKIDYLAGLLDGLPKVLNLAHYVEIVRTKGACRRALENHELAVKKLYAVNGNAAEVLAETFALCSNPTPEGDRKRELFHTYEELTSAASLSFGIQDILQNDGITAIGGPSGHGKTFLMLSIVGAQLSGRPLWGNFPVVEKAVRVLYLIPESAMAPFVYRLRLMRLFEYCAPNDGRLLVRTLSKGPAPKLNDPELLATCKGTYVFLDTAVRFADEGADENTASGNRMLADDLFGLIRAGARAVVFAHHSPKAFSKESIMTLETVLRGSGDIGAMLSTCWGVKQLDRENNIVHMENVKPRDFLPPKPFQLIGRPYIDQNGDFAMLKKPGECGSLIEEQPPEQNKGGASETAREAKAMRIEFVRQWLCEEPSLNSNDIAQRFRVMRIEVDASSIRRYRKELAL